MPMESCPSFSYQVKQELAGLLTDQDKRYACFYGMLLFSKQFGRDGIFLQTEHERVAELYCELADLILKKRQVVSCAKTEKKNQTFVFSLSIPSEEDRQAVLMKYHCQEPGQEAHILMENVDTNSLDMFLVGVFLVCGSITDPNKEYHMEFAAPLHTLCQDLYQVLFMVGVRAKQTERKRLPVLYIKESENIEDILTFMGATQSSLDIMNVKILKDVRNKANRIANCDAANIEKTVEASARQVQDIEIIQKHQGLEHLPVPLREIAEARLENPELSLRELGQILETPIGRSGANHRMQRLAEIARQLREEYHL